jgi:hypothetical protein
MATEAGWRTGLQRCKNVMIFRSYSRRLASGKPAKLKAVFQSGNETGRLSTWGCSMLPVELYAH